MSVKKFWTVVETEIFRRTAKAAGMTENEIFFVVNTIAADPLQGVEIGHGLRKVRVARRGEGKSGGFRVITWADGRVLHVLLIAALSKNQRENFSAQEVAAFKRLIDEE
jgi:hypothetical protein